MLTSKLKIWQSAVIYLAAALIITFPTILKLHTVLYGYATDAPYYLWLTWWRQYSWQHGLEYAVQPLMQAPFGASQVVPGFSGLLIPMALLAMVVGEVAAYNLMIIAAYALSGWLAFLVVRHFVEDQRVALIGGFLFMLSPYAVANTLHHVDLAQQWVIPLFALALIYHHEKASIMSAIGVGSAFALANYLNPYYGYHVVIMAVTFGVVESIWVAQRGGWREIFARTRIGLYAIAVIVGGMLFAPELVSIARTTYGENDPLHPFNQLAQPVDWFFYGSSRPWDFVLPSVSHPIIGSASKQIYDGIGSIQRLDFRLPFFETQGIDIDSRWFWMSHHSAQETMSLGFANLLVVTYVLYEWRKHPLDLNLRRWMGFFIALGILAMLFTLPPYLPVGALLRPFSASLHNVAIPMPSLFTMRFLAPLRGVIRIMPVVVLCLAVVVSYGLDRLLVRTLKSSLRYALVAGFVLTAGFEYLRFPVNTAFAAPDYTAWVAEQPAETVIAIYPYSSGDSIFQYVHERALINSISRPGTPPDMIVLTEHSTIGEMRAGVPERLAALGADYVIMTDGASGIAGLHEVKQIGAARIFQIAAEPVPLAVLYTTDGNMWISEIGWEWLSGDEKSLYVWNTYSEAKLVHLIFDGETPESVMVRRTHTALPAEMNLYGIRMANPLDIFEYPPNETIEIRIDDNGRSEEIALTLGETILSLWWSDSAAHEIVKISIEVVD